MNYYDENAQMAADRRRILMREAAAARLAGAAQVYRPSIGGRMLARLATWMIAEGTRLQARYEAIQSPPAAKRLVRTETILTP